MLRGGTAASRKPSVGFVAWWYRGVLFTAFSAFALLLLSLLSGSKNPATAVWVILWAPLMILLALRSARSAALTVDADEIVIHTLLRTRRIPLSSVRRVTVTRGTSAALIRWRVPAFELDDGTIVRADEIRGLRQPSLVDAVVTEVQRNLRR